MNPRAAKIALLACTLMNTGCVAEPAAPPDPAVQSSSTSEEVDLRQKIADLEARLQELESRIERALPGSVAFDPDREFTSLTIDEVVFDVPGESAWTPDDRMLLCHVVEWKDFEHLKGFTSVADKVFYLEAPGHPTLHAMMGTGGVTGSSGTTRYAYSVLHLTKGPLLPGVEYTLRPRNEVEGYRWLTVDSLRVARAD
jgi:hypothetical protein